MKVLLIVDLQNDFCPGGSLAVETGDEIVPLINALMSSNQFDEVVASKDWHPEGHMSFKQWPKHCVQGTKGAEFHPDLDTERITIVVHKGCDKQVDSYSAFFDNNKSKQTELKDYLLTRAKEKKVGPKDIEIFVCGLATDYCVAATARDAAELGFSTSVIVDACRAVNLKPDDEMRTLKDLAGQGVQLVRAKELLVPQGRHQQRGLQTEIHI